MNWIEEQLEKENLENYQNYRITEELRGDMTPSLKAVIDMLNSKRKVKL